MISRRVFLKDGAFALVTLGFAPSFLARTAFAEGRSARAKQLVAIFQRGAVDGLSVVVPFGEGDYYRLRPTIALARPAPAATPPSISTASSVSTPGWRPSSGSGTGISSPSSTRVDRPMPRGRTSTPRTTWRPQRQV